MNGFMVELVLKDVVRFPVIPDFFLRIQENFLNSATGKRETKNLILTTRKKRSSNQFLYRNLIVFLNRKLSRKN